MVIDCHVHVSAVHPSRGKMSQRLLRSIPFRFMRWRLGVGNRPDQIEQFEHAIRKLLFDALDGTTELDAAVVLAFDAVHDAQGRLDDARTHLYVKNDYVIELARQHPKILFGASVHPYRADAIAELERCIAAGAVLVKWLPIVQDFNPADARCIPFYECLAHHGIPLLSHTGGEKSLPNLDAAVASPALLEEALRRGVTVIAAHCGTRSSPLENDYLDQFIRMTREHERFYGDTAALSLPTRSYAYKTILEDPRTLGRIVHGSDWPIIPVPPVMRLGLLDSAAALQEPNWLRRDLIIKRMLGFDGAYWERAATIIPWRRSKAAAVRVGSPSRSSRP